MAEMMDSGVKKETTFVVVSATFVLVTSATFVISAASVGLRHIHLQPLLQAAARAEGISQHPRPVCKDEDDGDTGDETDSVHDSSLRASGICTVAVWPRAI